MQDFFIDLLVSGIKSAFYWINHTGSSLDFTCEKLIKEKVRLEGVVGK